MNTTYYDGVIGIYCFQAASGFDEVMHRTHWLLLQMKAILVQMYLQDFSWCMIESQPEIIWNK